MLVNRVTRTIHESPPNGRDQLDSGHPHLRKMDPRDLDALLADGYTMCGNCFPSSSGQARPASTTTRRPQSAPEKVDERVSATSESDADDGEDD